jgi:energy-coupling factor transporter ATP-binding protein EcfA2
MQIKQLRLGNFKIFSDAKIDFRPLTLLTGTNSSGKSTILNALTSILQTQQPYLFPFEFIPNGKNCSLGSFRDIVHKSNFKAGFSLGFTLEDPSRGECVIEGSYRYSSSGNQILPERIFFRVENDNFEIKWAGHEKGYRAIIRSNTHKEMLQNELMVNFSKSVVSILQSVDEGESSKKGAKKVGRNLANKFEHIFLGEQVNKWFGLKSRTPRELLEEMKEQPAGGLLVGILTSILSHFSKHSIYIGPVRVYPSRFYQTEDISELVDAMGNHSVNLLYDWKRHSPKKFAEVISIIKLLELASGVDTESSLDEILKLDIRPFKHRERVNLADVGFGVSQLLPIAIADVALPLKGTLLVNQPEVHLHPSSQAQLGNYFASRLKTRSYILETHSEYLINRLRALAVEGTLDVQNVSIIFLEAPVGAAKNPKIHYIEIGKDGSLNNAPKSFFETYFLDTFKIATGGFSNGG